MKRIERRADAIDVEYQEVRPTIAQRLAAGGRLAFNRLRRVPVAVRFFACTSIGTLALCALDRPASLLSWETHLLAFGFAAAMAAHLPLDNWKWPDAE